MHPPGMETGTDSSWRAGEETRGQLPEAGHLPKAPQGCSQLLPQPPAALMQRHRGLDASNLPSPPLKERKATLAPQKNPGIQQISPFPRRGAAFSPNIKTLLDLLSDELDGIFVLHPTLDQGQRDKDRSAERQWQWRSLPSHVAQRLTSHPGAGGTLQGWNGGIAGNRQRWLSVCNFLPFGCKRCPKERLVLGVKPPG